LQNESLAVCKKETQLGRMLLCC